MKKLFSLLLCVVMVLSLVACGSKTDDAQTPDEPQDTAPELSGTMKVVATGDVYGPLFDAFTADTGVEVECLSMSSGEVLSKLRAEGGTPSADLWFGGGIDAFMPPDKKYFEMERFEQTYETMLRKNPIGLPGSTAGQRQITE